MAVTHASTSALGVQPEKPTHEVVLTPQTVTSSTLGTLQLVKTPLAAATSFSQAVFPSNSSSSQLQPAARTAENAKSTASVRR